MTAYYNENDPKTAAWLRELIARGLVAYGDVDERSIEDVRPSDLAGYRQCHFFAGIGVWSYALRNAGFADDRAVWTGSCPCQPFSVAGKAAGFADERHLWPAWFHLISECRPELVFGEQVASKDGYSWLDLVSADLESLDYAFGPVVLPAAGFGAPHGRHRIFFVSDAALGRGRPLDRQSRSGIRQEIASGGYGVSLVVGESATRGRGTRGASKTLFGEESCRSLERSGDAGDVDNAGHGHRSHQSERLGTQAARSIAPSGGAGELADAAGGAGPEYEHESGRGSRRDASPSDSTVGGGSCAVADAKHTERGSICVNREHVGHGNDTGRSKAHGIIGTCREVRATNGFWSDAEWLYCRDEKYRAIEPGTFPLVDGAPARVVRLRGYGNAINAEVAKEFIKAYLETVA